MTAAAGGPAEDYQLNDDVVVEILLRLPTAAVLRARAVCNEWQRLSSSAEFIAAHARRRPLELIFQSGGKISGALETIPLGTIDEAERRSLRHVQYPAYTPTRGGAWRGYMLIDSCDGLLLFQRDGDRKDFAVCNPVTQQWRTVPRVPGAAAYTAPTGFYVHGPSGEHRLLCLVADDQGGGSHYVCSLELEADDAYRRLGQARPWPFGSLCADHPVRYVNLGGKLHWSQHPRICFSTDPWPPGEEELLSLTILVFDTVQETFRRRRHPPWKGEWCFLLEMDGKLAMGDFHILQRNVDIWVLQDYNDDESWTLRLRVHLPQQLLGSCWAMNTGTGVQILLGNFMRSWVAIYDVAEKRVLKQTHLVPASVNHRPLSMLVFKDTLERHPSIFTDESTPPFFSRKRKVHA